MYPVCVASSLAFVDHGGGGSNQHRSANGPRHIGIQSPVSIVSGGSHTAGESRLHQTALGFLTHPSASGGTVGCPMECAGFGFDW